MKTVNLTVSMTWRVKGRSKDALDCTVDFPGGDPVLYGTNGKPIPADKVEWVGHTTESVDIDNED